MAQLALQNLTATREALCFSAFDNHYIVSQLLLIFVCFLFVVGRNDIPPVGAIRTERRVKMWKCSNWWGATAATSPSSNLNSLIYSVAF